MREIKFRAWYSNKMIDVGQLDFFTDGQIHVNEELVGAKIMQYTGLKDKNSKEIYESDIVNYDRESFANGLIGLVEWSGSGFYIAQNIPLVTIVKKFNSDIEVIGNIYENPELLK